MKKLWKIISFMAVVNMLALLLFGGWLWQSGRVDRERLRTIKELLAQTLAEEASEADAFAAAEAAEAAEAEALARAADPPLPSDAQIQRVGLVQDQTNHGLRRLEDETSRLLAELNRRSAELEEREAQFDARQAAWEASIAGSTDAHAETQFKKTVALYERLAGKQAKSMLLELVAQGEMDRAVGYLDAMNTRAATKTLKELKSDEENRLATELLERIRTFGLGAEAQADSGNDEPLPPTP